MTDVNQTATPTQEDSMVPFGCMFGLKTEDFDVALLKATLEAKFGVTMPAWKEEGMVTTDEGDAMLYVAEWDNCMVFISHGKRRVPEALFNNALRLNYRLEQSDIPHYTAHHSYVRLNVLPMGNNFMGAATLMLRIALSLAGSGQIHYGFINDVLHSEPMLNGALQYMVETKDIPWPVLIWVGLYNNPDNTHNAYTVGMEMFKKRNFEIMGSDKDYQTLFELLINMSAFVCLNDATFNPGDTVEYTDTETIRLGLAKSQSYIGDVLTINFEAPKTVS